MQYTLNTKNPVAIKSLEYTHPEPYKNIPDKSTNLGFIEKLGEHRWGLLDLGCGGGKFVKDCNDNGIPAVGVEGSPHYFNYKWSEWATVPDKLFLCDITRPFKFNVKFGYVTAWEVMEHIPEESLETLFDNVKDNCCGSFVVSVSNKDCPSKDGKVDYHVTKKDKDWWIKRFEDSGFIRNHEEEELFEGSWVRNERSSFHLVWTL